MLLKEIFIVFFCWEVDFLVLKMKNIKKNGKVAKGKSMLPT